MKRLIVLIALVSSTSLACGYIPFNYWQITVEEAKRVGLPAELLGALVWVESKYCPKAVGKAGEIGLGQIMPSTGQMLGYNPAKLYDPRLNLRAAATYLMLQYRKFGSWKLALAAYNAGPARAYNPPRSTRQYVTNVLYVYDYLRRIHVGNPRSVAP